MSNHPHRPAKRFDSRRSGGFGVMELTIGMATALIALAIAVPKFGAVRTAFGMRAATSQVTTGLAAVRMRAIARNTRHRVTFTAPGSTYTIEREVAPNNFVAETGTKKLPSEVRFASVSPAAPIFDTRGMLAAPVTIVLTAAGSRTKTVTINALGEITLQ